MADILKVSPTGLKNTHPISRNTPDPAVPFEIKDVSKVVSLATFKQTEQQNQTITNQKHSEVLYKLLQQPEGTVQLIHSLMFLQQTVSMLGVDNETLHAEILSLLKSMFLDKSELMIELLAQSKGNTIFHGEIFEWISQLMIEHPHLKKDIARLLRSFCYRGDPDQIRQSLADRLLSLKSDFPKTLRDSVDEMLSKLQSDATRDDISRLMARFFKNADPQLFSNSLFTKAKYAIDQLMVHWFESCQSVDISSELKDVLGVKEESFVNMLENAMKLIESEQIPSKVQRAVVMTLLKLDSQPILKETVEQVVRSILSSPSFILPIHHFILPFKTSSALSYAECWIDNHCGNDLANDDSFTVLLSAEIESLGHFEVEIKGVNHSLEIFLYTPEGLVDRFFPVSEAFKRIAKDRNYNIARVSVQSLKGVRTLLDVFPRLASLQSGVDMYV